METFNIETNFALSLTYNGIFDVWEPLSNLLMIIYFFYFIFIFKKFIFQKNLTYVISYYWVYVFIWPPRPKKKKLVLVFNNFIFLLGKFQKPTFMTSGYFVVFHENCRSFDVCKITRTNGSLIIIPPPPTQNPNGSLIMKILKKWNHKLFLKSNNSISCLNMVMWWELLNFSFWVVLVFSNWFIGRNTIVIEMKRFNP
jgi:hypothetical protein